MKNIDWKILKVLYEKRSITKAADALFMTQSALTKRLQSIESEWGRQLVERTSRGVTFTEDGKYLVQKANIMLDFLQEIGDHFADRHTKMESLKLGVPNSFAKRHLPKLLAAYQKSGANLYIKTISNSSDVILKDLIDDTIDIGLVCGGFPYLGDQVCLFQEELYIVAPKTATMDSIEHMPLIETFYNPMVRMIINQWWKSQFGSSPHEKQQVPYFDIAIEMAENGLGICFVFGDDWKIDEEKLQLIPAYDRDGNPVSRKVSMLISDRCYKSEGISDFIRFVENYYGVN